MEPLSGRESDLIETAYRAAGTPALWEETLPEWASLFGADEALLVAEEFSSAAPPIRHCTRPPEDLLWEAYFGRHRSNPFTAASLALPAGAVGRTDEALPRRALLDSAFYQEVLEPLGVLHSLGANLINEPGMFGYLAFLRGPRSGRFEAPKLDLLSRLTRHLGQAMRLQLHLEGLTLEHAAALDALYHVARGVILVTAHGRIVFSNAAAERLLQGTDGLRSEKTRLRAWAPSDDASLQRLVANACRDDGSRVGGGMVVRRMSGPALTLEVLPIGEVGLRVSRAAPRAAIYVGDPARPPCTSSKRLLAQVFGLTPKEAEVCTLLVEGLSLKAIGERLAVSTTTVRTHLAHAFDKTGARRQADLVKMLLAVSSGTHGAESGR